MGERVCKPGKGQIDPAKSFYIAIVPYWMNETVREDLSDSVVGGSISQEVAAAMGQAWINQHGGDCFVAKVEPIEKLTAKEPTP